MVCIPPWQILAVWAPFIWEVSYIPFPVAIVSLSHLPCPWFFVSDSSPQSPRSFLPSSPLYLLFSARTTPITSTVLTTVTTTTSCLTKPLHIPHLSILNSSPFTTLSPHPHKHLSISSTGTILNTKIEQDKTLRCTV